MKTAKQNKYVLAGVVYIFAAVIIMVAAVALVVYKPNKAFVNQPDLPVQNHSGTITRINDNGHDVMLNEHNEKVAGPAYGIVDVGTSITVGDKSFSTSCGNCGADDSFYVNIDELKLGDSVQVTYAINSIGARTLNCKQCGVSKLR